MANHIDPHEEIRLCAQTVAGLGEAIIPAEETRWRITLFANPPYAPDTFAIGKYCQVRFFALFLHCIRAKMHSSPLKSSIGQISRVL
jgi:hypothetical protein